MSFKKILIGIVLSILITSPALANELKMSVCLPASTDSTKILEDTFIKLGKQAKNYTLKYLGGPEITPGNRQGEALQRGLVDIIYCPASFYSGILREGRLIGAQNLSLDDIRANGGWHLMQQAWQVGMNAKILAWDHNPAQNFYIYTNKKPQINNNTGIDLTGLKIRSSPSFKSFLKALNATPVNVSAPDTFSALERGLIDGVVFSGSIIQNGWAQYVKYRIDVPILGSTRLLIINNNSWNKLSKPAQQELIKHSREYEKSAYNLVLDLEINHTKELLDRKVVFIDLTDNQKKAFLKTVYRAKWAENDATSGYKVDYNDLKQRLYKANE